MQILIVCAPLWTLSDLFTAAIYIYSELADLIRKDKSSLWSMGCVSLPVAMHVWCWVMKLEMKRLN